MNGKFFCLFGWFLMSLSRADAESDWEMKGHAWETKIRTLLAEARTNDILEIVCENEAVFGPVRFKHSKLAAEEFSQYFTHYPERVLSINLELVQLFYAAIDKTYDIDHPPRMFIDSSFDSPDAYTPEEWKERNKKFDENRRHIQKYDRERKLRDYFTRLLRLIQIDLKGREDLAAAFESLDTSKAADVEQRMQYTARVGNFKELADRHVSDPKLREIIFSKNLVNGPDAKAFEGRQESGK